MQFSLISLSQINDVSKMGHLYIVLRYIEIEKYIQMPSSGDQIVNHHFNSLCHDI